MLDLIARYGGEEFCVICAGRDGEELRKRFDEFRAQLAGEPVTYAGQAIPSP